MKRLLACGLLLTIVVGIAIGNANWHKDAGTIPPDPLGIVATYK